MEPIHRRYHAEDDYWRIREFLRRLYLLNGRHLTSWHVARLDYARCYVYLNVDGVQPNCESVGTAPAHRRLGLSRALLTEGLRRLQRMGATRAFVCGYSDEANALYRSVIGPEHDLYESWVKEWRS